MKACRFEDVRMVLQETHQSIDRGWEKLKTEDYSQMFSLPL